MPDTLLSTSVTISAGALLLLLILGADYLYQRMQRKQRD